MAQDRRHVTRGEDSRREDRVRLLQSLIVICRRIARVQATAHTRQVCREVELKLQKILATESGSRGAEEDG
jgi:hypothetical protein